jgi:hypothetical protein
MINTQSWKFKTGFATREETKMVSQYPADFEAFWNAYPRRIAKKAAFKAFECAVREGAEIEKILSSVAAYKRWLSNPDTWRPEPAHPTTWLNQGRWDDELEDQKPEIQQISFKIPPVFVEKLKSTGMPEHTVKRWFDDAHFIEDGRCIMFKSEFMREHVRQHFDGNLQRAFGFMPELAVGKAA